MIDVKNTLLTNVKLAAIGSNNRSYNYGIMLITVIVMLAYYY